MIAVALVFCFAVVALGLLGVVSPPRLVDTVRRFQSPGGLYLAAGIRLVLGVALVVIAPETRAPQTIWTLGAFIIVAGLATPFFGVERFRRLLDWWAAQGDAFLRAWAVFALAFGLLLVYALVP